MLINIFITILHAISFKYVYYGLILSLFFFFLNFLNLFLFFLLLINSNFFFFFFSIFLNVILLFCPFFPIVIIIQGVTLVHNQISSGLE